MLLRDDSLVAATWVIVTRKLGNGVLGLEGQDVTLYAPSKEPAAHCLNTHWRPHWSR